VVFVVLAALLMMAAGCGNKSGNNAQSSSGGQAVSTSSSSGQTQSAQPSADTQQKEEPAAPAWKPERQVEIIIPFSAGGGNDVMARRVAKVAEDLKLVDTPFKLTNMPGANGQIGSAFVANKAGDPHYLVPISGLFWLGALLNESEEKTDPVNDFTPIAQFGKDTETIAVAANSKYQTFDDIIQAAKENPGKITWAVAGTASAELEIIHAVEQAKGVKFNVIPFSGGGDAIKAVVGGHVDVGGREPGTIKGYVDSGDLRPIATAFEKRVDVLPDVPTLKELGVDVNYFQVRGIAAPKGITPEQVAYYEDLFRKVSESEEFQTALKEASTISEFKGAAEFAEVVKERWDFYEQLFGELGLLPGN
jgi:putative tricarboxylic transport membrane protein